METFFTSRLDEVLVGADTSGFEGFRRQLFVLVGDQVDTCWEVVDTRTLAAKIENTDLRVGHTTIQCQSLYPHIDVLLIYIPVEARLGVRLVLAVAVATSWSVRR